MSTSEKHVDNKLVIQVLREEIFPFSDMKPFYKVTQNS